MQGASRVIYGRFLSHNTQSLAAIAQNLVDRASEISSTMVETNGPEDVMMLF
jgi:hypothetical protein